MWCWHIKAVVMQVLHSRLVKFCLVGILFCLDIMIKIWTLWRIFLRLVTPASSLATCIVNAVTQGQVFSSREGKVWRDWWLTDYLMSFRCNWTPGGSYCTLCGFWGKGMRAGWQCVFGWGACCVWGSCCVHLGGGCHSQLVRAAGDEDSQAGGICHCVRSGGCQLPPVDSQGRA